MTDKDKGSRIIAYWAEAMLNYRQPKGGEASKKLIELTDIATANAIFAITGMVQAGILNGKKKNIKKLKWLASFD